MEKIGPVLLTGIKSSNLLPPSTSCGVHLKLYPRWQASLLRWMSLTTKAMDSQSPAFAHPAEVSKIFPIVSRSQLVSPIRRVTIARFHGIPLPLPSLRLQTHPVRNPWKACNIRRTSDLRHFCNKDFFRVAYI